MSSPAISSEPAERRTPHLRLVHEEPIANMQAPAAEQPWDGSTPSKDAQVLVAGADTSARSKMRDELHDLLPAGTRFTEAAETWEVIARAPASSMVVLAGDLGDVSASSLMTLLGRRHPTLPVLAVSKETPARAAADVDVAGA